MVYLAFAAAVAALGSALRAWAHNDKDLKGADFAGKLLNVSSAVLACAGGVVRLNPDWGPYLPWTSILLFGIGALVLMGAALWVGRRLQKSERALEALTHGDASRVGVANPDGPSCDGQGCDSLTVVGDANAAPNLSDTVEVSEGMDAASAKGEVL